MSFPGLIHLQIETEYSYEGIVGNFFDGYCPLSRWRSWSGHRQLTNRYRSDLREYWRSAYVRCQGEGWLAQKWLSCNDE